MTKDKMEFLASLARFEAALGSTLLTARELCGWKQPNRDEQEEGEPLSAGYLRQYIAEHPELKIPSLPRRCSARDAIHWFNHRGRRLPEPDHSILRLAEDRQVWAHELIYAIERYAISLTEVTALAAECGFGDLVCAIRIDQPNANTIRIRNWYASLPPHHHERDYVSEMSRPLDFRNGFKGRRRATAGDHRPGPVADPLAFMRPGAADQEDTTPAPGHELLADDFDTQSLAIWGHPIRSLAAETAIVLHGWWVFAAALLQANGDLSRMFCDVPRGIPGAPYIDLGPTARGPMPDPIEGLRRVLLGQTEVLRRAEWSRGMTKKELATRLGISVRSLPTRVSKLGIELHTLNRQWIRVRLDNLDQAIRRAIDGE